MSVRRIARAAGCLVALIALLAGLTACRKPAPRISVYGDGTTVQVSAAFYAQKGGPRREYVSDFGDAPVISVRAGSQLHIDVPRQVSGSWVVVPLVLDSAGKSTALPGIAPQEVLRDRHSVTLSTQAAGYRDFFIEVAQLRGNTQAGGWVFHVRITS